ncbi:MAG: sarcosine oxidase subunit gamma [Silicimonas sp.]|nr:sarcosine oxidase subunit gamma [Silicimonas sp.]
MADLIARPATHGLLPIEIGSVVLEDAQPEAITWIAPYNRKKSAVTRTLGGFPGPGQVVEVKAGRALSVGPGQALILGAPAACDDAAVVDQSDGWTVVALDGAAARDVLARLTPLDLRDSALSENATARTLLGHMTASITRTGPYRYELMVFRSMTQTLIHELTRAMKHVAARARLSGPG